MQLESQDSRNEARALQARIAQLENRASATRQSGRTTATPQQPPHDVEAFNTRARCLAIMVTPWVEEVDFQRDLAGVDLRGRNRWASDYHRQLARTQDILEMFPTQEMRTTLRTNADTRKFVSMPEL